MQLKIGGAGAQMRGFTIEYVADGEPYLLGGAWQAIGCGNEVADPQLCTN